MRIPEERFLEHSNSRTSNSRIQIPENANSRILIPKDQIPENQWAERGLKHSQLFQFSPDTHLVENWKAGIDTFF